MLYIHLVAHTVSYAPEVNQAIGNFFSQVGTTVSTAIQQAMPFIREQLATPQNCFTCGQH